MACPAPLPQFLYRLVPARPAMLVDGPTEHEARAVQAHFEHLQRLVAQGVVLMAGRTTDTGERTFGLVVFVAPTQSDAEAIVRSDPAVAEGVMDVELFPYRVSLWATGFTPAA